MYMFKTNISIMSIDQYQVTLLLKEVTLHISISLCLIDQSSKNNFDLTYIEKDKH